MNTKRNRWNSITQEDFISRSKSIHHEKYDYSLVSFINTRGSVKIICPIHGEFTQRAAAHLAGRGCRKCGTLVFCEKKTKSTDIFIKKAISIHGNLYDYSHSKYEKSAKKLEIICDKHGSFWQAPNVHLKGTGCPSCKKSRGELRIKLWLDTNHILYIDSYVFEECRYLRQLPFDFYLIDYNLCIEYDGLQHFVPSSFGSSRDIKTKNENLEIIKKRDQIKNQYCSDNNIKLLRIAYWDFNNIDDILKRNIYESV